MMASIWLYNLTSYSLQIAILIGAGALLAHLLRPRTSTVTLAYWQILLFACLLLPVCQPWKKPVKTPPVTMTDGASWRHVESVAPGEPPAVVRTASWPTQETVLLLLGGGIALRGAWLALGLLSLRRFRRRSSLLAPDVLPLATAEQRLGVHAAFYTSDKTTSPITFGLFRPVIILPYNVLKMGTEIQEAIVYHELLHVRRRDWIYEIVEECIRTVLWFHPAIWWLIGRIQLSREQVVDRVVIQLTESREQYVEALLTVALAKSRIPLIPAPLFLRKRLLKKRVAEIFKETSMSRSRLALFLVSSSCLAILAASAAVRMFPLEDRSQPNSAPIQVIRGGEHLIHGGPLEYPRRAVDRRIEGDVLLELSVNDQGQVSDARVLSGPEELRRAALQSVLQWHYANTMRLPGMTQAVIRFHLPAEGAPGEVIFEGHRALFATEVGDVHILVDPEIKMKDLSIRINNPNTSAEERAQLQRQLVELKKMVEVVEDPLTPGQRTERQMKEIHEAMANRNLSAAEKDELKRKLLELKMQMERIRADHSEQQQAAGWATREFLERNLKETEEKLADPRLPAEDRAKLIGHVEELRTKIGINGGTRKLTRIRSEGLSDSAVQLVSTRLGVQVGDTITPEAIRRVTEAVREVDEHLRIMFHADAGGGIELVILAP